MGTLDTRSGKAHFALTSAVVSFVLAGLILYVAGPDLRGVPLGFSSILAGFGVLQVARWGLYRR